MVGDFNLKRFLTENKVTVASQHLAELSPAHDLCPKCQEIRTQCACDEKDGIRELDVQDPNITGSVKEFYELQQEMATMKSRLKEMEGRFKEFEGVIKPMLDDMKELGDKLAMAGEYMIKVTKFGGERMDASYKDAFENALTKVNAATKNVLNEALEASKKLTQVKHSISIQPSDTLSEGVMGRISSAFQGFLKRLTGKVDIAAKAVEDFINVAADILPGGEEVDDTPNPVLEGANSYGMPGSSVVKEKKSGSAGSAPKAPKADSEKKEEEDDSEEGDSDVQEVLDCFKDLSKEQQLEVAKQIAKHLKPKEKKEEKKNPFEKKEVEEDLKGGQKKLDKDGDGDIDSDDFKLMKK